MNQNIPPVNQVYHGDNAIHARIQKLMQESKDPEFTRCLSQLGSALWEGHISDKFASEEIDKNYYAYQQKMLYVQQQQMQQQQQPGYIYPGQFQYVSKPIAETTVKPKKNMEFAVGAGVLGVTGAIFLLIAFVIFAMNFMSGLVKGICLYAIAATVILVSELLVRRKQEKFALGMTAVGISGLFLCTVINYTYLCIFNSVVAFILIGITAVITLFFTYKKDSGIFRIITSSGSVICLLPMIAYEDVNKYLMTCAMVIIIQMAAALIPAKREQRAIWIIQMIVQVVSIIMLSLRGKEQNIVTQWNQLFVVMMIALLNLLFLRAKVFAGSVVTYCIIYFINIIMLPMHMLEYPNFLYSILPLAVVTLVFTILLKHDTCRWIPYWFFNSVVLSALYENGSKFAYEWIGFISIVSLFIWAKAVSKVRKLRISECIITVLTFVYLLGISADRCGTEIISTVMLLILTICFIISVITINYWHTFYQLTVTASAIVCVLKLCQGVVRLPIVTGLIILSMFLFSLIKKNKTETSVKIYNILALCITAICYLCMLFVGNIYIYIIMLLFGITVFVFFFDEKYSLATAHKNLWIGLFLTYMFFVLDVPYPIINSVLLAGTAILCVAMGFVAKDKPARIYGIVMAIVVAFKVALFDFAEMEVLQRMLTFLIVGVLIIIISYIYILLEKKLSQDDN